MPRDRISILKRGTSLLQLFKTARSNAKHWSFFDAPRQLSGGRRSYTQTAVYLITAKKVKKRRRNWKYQEETGSSFLFEARKKLYDKYVGGEDGAEDSIRDELEIL